MRLRRLPLKRALNVMGIALLITVYGQPASADSGQVGSLEKDQQRIAVARLVMEPGALWKAQEDLDRVIEDIRASAPGGFSGAVVDVDHNSLSVYWHGAVPSRVTERIDDARVKGIRVVAQSAPYTEAELLQEADRMSRMPLFRGARTGQRMMSVSPRPDGTGLDVGVHGLPLGVDSVQARQMIPALDSNIPLSITPMDPISFSSRAFDSPAYWGGSYILNRPSSAQCSSAFGVTNNIGAATFLMTASHCSDGGEWGSALYTDGSGNVQQDVYGTMWDWVDELDALLIHTPEGSGGYVYWGSPINPPNGDPGSLTGVPVGGDSANNVGDSICLSGSFTGTICSSQLRITAINQTITFDPPINDVGRITNQHRAADLAGRVTGIAGHGDSGGPAVSIRSDGKLLARGILAAIELGAAEKPCVGYNPPGRKCSSIVYFGDIRTAMNALHVRINTA